MMPITRRRTKSGTVLPIEPLNRADDDVSVAVGGDEGDTDTLRLLQIVQFTSSSSGSSSRSRLLLLLLLLLLRGCGWLR